MDKFIDILDAEFSNLCQVDTILKKRKSSYKLCLNNESKEHISKNEVLIERPSFFEPINYKKRQRSNAFSE